MARCGRAPEGAPATLLDAFVAARTADDVAMTTAELIDETVSLLLAGNETSSVTMTWFFHELAHRPDVRRRVHAEVDAVLGDAPVTAAHLSQLSYTQQVVKEVLRVYSVWILTRRTTTELTVGGARIPADANLLYSHYALHRDPRHFPDPERFDPDRWAPGHTLPREAFMPFGAGPHRCVGEHAFLTLGTVLAATLCRRWLLEPAGPTPKPRNIRAIPSPNSLHLTLRRRSTARA